MWVSWHFRNGFPGVGDLNSDVGSGELIEEACVFLLH